MTKRKKINNNQPTINLRLPEDLKRELENQSYLKNQTVSKYVRELLSNYFSGELFKKEISHYKNTQFISSLAFIKLITWVYKKKKNTKKNRK